MYPDDDDKRALSECQARYKGVADILRIGLMADPGYPGYPGICFTIAKKIGFQPIIPDHWQHLAVWVAEVDVEEQTQRMIADWEKHDDPRGINQGPA